MDSENQVIVAVDLTTNEYDNGYLPAMIEHTQESTGFTPDLSLAHSGYCDEFSLRWIEDNNQNVLLPPLENPQKINRNDLVAYKSFYYHEERDVVISPAGDKCEIVVLLKQCVTRQDDIKFLRDFR